MKLFRLLLPFSIIVCIWLLFASPYVIKNKAPFPSRYLVTFFQPWQPFYGMPSKNNAMPDIITQIYPWRFLSVVSIANGGWGLWNPYSFSGTVHAANYQSAPFFPLNILFRFLPFIDGWSIIVLLQPLSAAFFMYIFLRSISRTTIASLIGSISFMFCGFITVWMAYGTLVWSVAFLPLLLWAINNIALRKKLNANKVSLFEHILNGGWYGIVLSLGVGSSFLAGHFQISLYVLLVTLLYALTKPNKIITTSLFYIAIGILLAFPQLLVSLQAFSSSNRSENFITTAGIPFYYLITLFAPDFFGNPVTRNDWFGQYAEWSSYIGILPLFFASFAFFVDRFKSYRFFLLVLVSSLLLAIASPVSQLFYQLRIPVLSTSVATRMIVFSSFSLIVFATLGIDLFRAIVVKKKRIVILGFVLFWVIIVGSIWGSVVFGSSFTHDQLNTATRNLVLSTMFILFGLSLLLVSLRFSNLKKVALVGIIVITAVDLLRFSTKWMPFEEKEYVFPQIPIITEITKRTGYNRVFSNIGNEMSTLFKIPSIEGYDALYQSRYGEFISAAGDGVIKPLERSVVRLDRGGLFTQQWLDLLGAKYLLYRKSDGRNVWVFPHWEYPFYQSVYEDEQYQLFENTNALPRAFLVSSYALIEQKQDIINTITSTDFNIRDQIVLEERPEYEPQNGDGLVDIIKYTPENVVIKTKTTSPQLLYLSDVYDKGWKVTINGIPSDIYRANYAFRAVLVPNGEATVVFRYKPLSFQFGLLSSLIAIFVLIGVSMRQFIYDRRLL